MAVKASATVTLSCYRDTQSVTRYYKLQSSTSSAPSKPTANPPSGWDDSEPSYSSGSTNTLYFCDLTVFSDGTWTYSTVSKSSSYEAAKEAYNKAVNAQNTANELQNSLDIALDVIIGTQTAATGSWTGVAKFASLVDGQQIIYWLPYAGSGNATLNLTLSDGSTTGAKNCYYGGTSRLATHYPAGSTIRFTYRENVSIAGSSTKYTGWWADANYSSDTYDRTRYSKAIKCGTTAIAAANIIVGSNGVYQHLKTGAAFDISYPILYASSAISASSTGTSNYITIPFTVTTTQSITLTTYKPVYIKGTLSGTMFTPVSTTPLTQTVPTSDDGYDYILLGSATSSTTEMYLMPEHPIFTYYNGGFKSFEQIAAEGAKAAEDAQKDIDDLEIGGRNLIRDSCFENESSIDNTYQKFGNNSKKIINDNPEGTSTKYVGYSASGTKLSIEIDDAKGKNLVFSLWVYFEEITFTGYEFRIVYTKNGVTQWSGVNRDYSYNIPSVSSLVQGWNYLYGVYTISEDTTRLEASFNIYNSAGASGNCWISSPKLEFGTRPTAWSAAPEDIEEKIETVSNALDASLDVIVGTQTASTNAWTGVAKFASLTDGQRIAYWLPYAGTSTSATLNLTLSDGSTTGAIACYRQGTSRITTHYPAGTVIHLTYRKDVSIAGSTTKYTGWWSSAAYDSGNTYDRTRYAQPIKAGTTAITSGNLIVAKDGTYTHLKLGNAFDLTYPILYAGSSISASSTGTNNYLAIPFTVTTTQSITFTTYEPVYIKGTINGSLFTPVSTTPLTQTVPTSEDDYHYILLGTAYSTTGMYLLNEHPIFQYYKGAFKTVEQIAMEASQSAENAQQTADDAQSTADSAENNALIAKAAIQTLADSISMLVTDSNGTSLMTQTDTGWTFNITEIQNAVDIASENIGTLIGNLSDVNATVDVLEQAVNDLGVTSEYIKITVYEDEPCINLGESDSDFKLLITNTRIMFMDGSNIPTYINTDGLITENIRVENELQQGDFVWKVRSNGNLCLMWKGESE